MVLGQPLGHFHGYWQAGHASAKLSWDILDKWPKKVAVISRFGEEVARNSGFYKSYSCA